MENSLMFTEAEASRSGFAPVGKELPTPKNRMVGAGTEMAHLRLRLLMAPVRAEHGGVRIWNLAGVLQPPAPAASPRRRI